ncbi:MAG: amidohydrolase family protein [Acidobacteria bacterium]|nr:amidohydrolase family protein [Acidobacteriota bacterium]
MLRKTCLVLCSTILLTLPALGELTQIKPQTTALQNISLVNGRWFNGKSFEPSAVYSVNGHFTVKKPARVDRTLDLAGSWIVLPFGEAHNHNLNGIEERDRKAIQKYLADGVFYVKLPSNFFVSDELKTLYRLNQPESIDVVMAQGATLTTTGGHPYRLAEEVWFRFGYAKGPVEALNGHRFFTIDSETDLEQKWPQILRQRPDFIKTTLWVSAEREQRKNNKKYYGEYGLDPKFLPKIVAKAHSAKLRVSTHVNDATDFHIALAAGVDEIVHLPLSGLTPIAIEDAKLAAKRGVTVITTCAIVPSLPFIPKSDLPQALNTQLANLKLLRRNNVRLAIGSDNVSDSSLREFEYLQKLGVFDNLTLLKMWTETTAKAIFPQRKIGALSEGYEASFLALEGNPLEDLQNVRRIKFRFKQGKLLEL